MYMDSFHRIQKEKEKTVNKTTMCSKQHQISLEGKKIITHEPSHEKTHFQEQGLRL